MNTPQQLPPLTPGDDPRVNILLRMTHFEDELRYTRQDMKRLEERLDEIKSLIKEQSEESRRVKEELHRELNRRIQPLEREKIWITGWIAGASVIVGIAVSFIKQVMGW